MKHPKLPRLYFEKSGSGKATASTRKLKALRRVEQPYPESMEKRAERQRIPGMGDSLTG